MDYSPRPDDIRFILEQVLHAPAQLQALPPLADVDHDLLNQVLDEARKFVGLPEFAMRMQLTKSQLGEAAVPAQAN